MPWLFTHCLISIAVCVCVCVTRFHLQISADWWPDEAIHHSLYGEWHGRTQTIIQQTAISQSEISLFHQRCHFSRLTFEAFHFLGAEGTSWGTYLLIQRWNLRQSIIASPFCPLWAAVETARHAPQLTCLSLTCVSFQILLMVSERAKYSSNHDE